MPVSAALVAGGIAAAGSIYGSNKAAGAIDAASGASIQAQRDMFNQARADIAPWREAGAASLDQIKALLGLGGVAPDYSTFYNQPDYLFAQQQGEQALLRNKAATGDLMSGETGKALQTFGQGLASQKFADYYNRLAGLAGIGANVTSQLNQQGAGVGANIGNALMAGGAGQASSYLNQGNTLASLATGVGNNYIFSNYLKGLAPGGNPNVIQGWSPSATTNLAAFAPNYGGP